MNRSHLFFEADQGGGTGGAGGEGTTTATATQGGSTASTLLSGTGATTTQATTTTPLPNWISDDGKLDPKWLEKLPEDLRGHASIQSIGTVQDLAKSYIHTKGLVGTKLEMPGEGAPPEAIANWRKVVGAPEKPEGYLGELKTLRPDTIPENLWDAEGEKSFLALAHKHHLPPAAVKELIAFDVERLTKTLGQSEAEQTEIVNREGAALKADWGNDYSAKLNIAARMAATVGLKTDDPIFTNSRVVKAFHAMAALVSEDRLVKGDPAVMAGGTTQEQIRTITDPTSQHQLAKAYRGEINEQAQQEAQKQLHHLYAAAAQK
jgi:hypothetical protein